MPEETMDLERLLSPISENEPCGASLRWDPVWSKIQQLRKPKRGPVPEIPDEPPNWSAVAEQAADLLAVRSKDLMLAAWYVEASLRSDGIVGLRRGFTLLDGLIERFWGHIHPQPEGDDLEQRLAPLIWLTDNKAGSLLPRAIRQAEIFPKVGDEAPSLVMWEARHAKPQTSTEDTETYTRRLEESTRLRDLFDKASSAASIAHMQRLQDDLSACTELASKIDARLTAQCGGKSPSWSALKDELNDVQRFVRTWLKERGGTAVDPEAAEMINGAESPTRSSGTAGLSSRREAVRKLEEAAAYFAGAEPHSPVGYLVQRAIRWANLPFEQLLAELVKEGQSLAHVRETLGLSSTNEPAE